MTVACAGAALAAQPAARTTPRTGALQLNCAASPHLCGYPDATNTGIQLGHALTAVPARESSGPGWYYNRTYGSVEVTGTGAVLANLAVTGNIDVKASGVTLDNVRVINSGNDYGIGLRHADRTLIEHCEVYSPVGADRLQVGIKDVYGDSFGTTVAYDSIWRTSTGIQLGDGTLTGNYVHDLALDAGDHVNGIKSEGGDSAGLKITGNTVLNPVGQTDAIGLFENFGQQTNATITGNLMSGGGYEIYGGANPGKWIPARIVITGNRFATNYYRAGGSYGPAAAVAAGVNGNTWSANIWDTTGLPVNP